VEQLAKDDSFLDAFDKFDENPDLFDARQTIANPINNTRWEGGERIEVNPRVAKARQMLLDDPDRGELVPFLAKRLYDTAQDYPEATSWFINDREGNQICSVFPSENHTQLNNYAFRTYFTGEDRDLVYGSENDSATDEVLPDSISDRQIIRQPHLSAIFLSQATNTWKVAFSAPIVRRGQSRGIVAVTVELGEFIEFSNLPDQYVMLVDNRDGDKTGTILEHPLLAALRKELASPVPRRLLEKTVSSPDQTITDFFDPMGQEEEGTGYRRQSIAAKSPVTIKRKPISTQESTTVEEAADQDGAVSIDTGLVVLAVEGYDRVIEPVNLLTDRLLKLLLTALLSLASVAFCMWWLVNRTSQNNSQDVTKLFGPANNQSWLAEQETQRQT